MFDDWQTCSTDRSNVLCCILENSLFWMEIRCAVLELKFSWTLWGVVFKVKHTLSTLSLWGVISWIGVIVWRCLVDINLHLCKGVYPFLMKFQFPSAVRSYSYPKKPWLQRRAESRSVVRKNANYTYSTHEKNMAFWTIQQVLGIPGRVNFYIFVVKFRSIVRVPVSL